MLVGQCFKMLWICSAFIFKAKLPNILSSLRLPPFALTHRQTVMIWPGARSNMYTIRPSVSSLLYFSSQWWKKLKFCVSQEALNVSIMNWIQLSPAWMAYDAVTREARRWGGLAVRGRERDSAAAGKIQMCQVDTRELGCYRKWRSWLYKAHFCVRQRNSVKLLKIIAWIYKYMQYFD